MSIDGIISEQNTNFVGKDGFFWWIGEVEDNEDPLQLGRVKVRVLNYYTSPDGSSATKLPTDDLPWATVLQGTDQAGNDGQGQSSGQLQPGAIVMGFFMDGEDAQMPLVMGVIRGNKNQKKSGKKFLFTGLDIPNGVAPNPGLSGLGSANTTKGFDGPVKVNTVNIPGSGRTPGAAGSPNDMSKKVNGSSANPGNVRQPPKDKPIPAASGTGGPWKTLEYELNYLIQDLVDTATSLVKSENGEFIDVFENKVFTAQQLVAKLKNFLSAVFAQVVSAIRAQLDELVQKIEKSSFITSFLGIPGTTFAAIQAAISAILSLICGIDQQIVAFINDPIGFVLQIVEQLVEGAIDAATAFVQGVQGVLDKMFCAIEGMLSSVLKVIDTVKTVLNTVSGAKEIIDAWEKGSDIFNGKFDLSKLSIEDIAGIITLLLSFFDFGCDRKANGGQDTVGFFPFFGVTSCTPAALAAHPASGNPNPGCGGNAATSFIDSFIAEADPYLTAAQNFVNGAYSLQLGTPGRTATINRSASGTTTFSVRANNAELAKHKANTAIRTTIKRQNPQLTPSELDKKVEEYVKRQTASSPGKTEQGDYTADHTSYAGNHTCDVRGDDCKVIDGDYVRTIEGDYRLKVTGDCHIEVGGGFFMNAQGAPKQADKKGKDKDDKDKIQKHTIQFGSDVDFNISGANLKMQAVKMELAAREQVLSSSSFKNLGKTQNMSGGEVVISAANAFTVDTKTLTEKINTPPLGAAGGRYSFIGGPVTFTQTPALAGGTPPFTVTTPGPFLVTCAAGGATFTVGAGAFTANVATGAIALNAAAGAASITAGGALTLTAGAALVATATVIKLN